MLKIAIFCGGTGSVALQTGFDQIYDSKRIQLDIIVNAYDNGKSTGVCRRVFNNQILGPSDVRKNQLLQFSLQYGQELLEPESRYSRLYQLFNLRLSAADALSYYDQAYRTICDFEGALDPAVYSRLLVLLRFFFFEENVAVLRPTTLGERFEDFSLSNIFYAASAALNGNSLQAAAKEMADILEIKDNVHLISDKSLILKAKTASGRIIDDEGEIVAWDNPLDTISSVMLFDGKQEYTPSVDEGICGGNDSVKSIVEKADIVIFSSGTQWSSLIPTYMHHGFAEMIQRSKAKKYLIMNNIEDHDAAGVGAAELCGILERYLDLNQITIVINKNACSSMNSVVTDYRIIREALGLKENQKHDPQKLVKAIMADYYGPALACRYQFFDLDGTLWNASGTELEIAAGHENLRLFCGAIVTGNTVKHVVDVWKHYGFSGKAVDIYADYGNTHFEVNHPDQINYLSDQYFLDKAIYQELSGMQEFSGKATMRGGTVISIKPLKNRLSLVNDLNQKLAQRNRPVLAKIAGRTTIDVTYADYTKAAMLEQILIQGKLPYSDVLFVGNELEQGSEKEITAVGIKTLAVNDVFECNSFLRTKRMMEESAHDC